MLILLIIETLSRNTTSIRKMLLNKQYKEAYQESNSMIQEQKLSKVDNILFLLRGKASVKMGEYSQGISDLSRFLRKIDVNNDVTDVDDAYSLRCTSYLKLGYLENAYYDANISQNVPLMNKIQKAINIYKSAHSNETTLRSSLNKYLELIEICSSSSQIFAEAADTAFQLGHYPLFSQFIEKAFKFSPKDAKILELKAKKHLINAEIDSAQKYARMCIEHDSSKCSEILKSIENFNENEKNAKISISNKDLKQAEKNIIECRKIAQKYSKYDSPLVDRVREVQLDLLVAENRKQEALRGLNGLIKKWPKNMNLLLQRGRILITLDDYSGAIHDFQIVKRKTAPNSNENKQAIALILKAFELEWQNIDFYEILGLNRSATAEEVKRSYRRLKRKESGKKIDLVDKAYVILGNEKLRQMYDLKHYNKTRGKLSDEEQFSDFEEFLSIEEEYFEFEDAFPKETEEDSLNEGRIYKSSDDFKEEDEEEKEGKTNETKNASSKKSRIFKHKYFNCKKRDIFLSIFKGKEEFYDSIPNSLADKFLFFTYYIVVSLIGVFCFFVIVYSCFRICMFIVKHDQPLAKVVFSPFYLLANLLVWVKNGFVFLLSKIRRLMEKFGSLIDRFCTLIDSLTSF